MKELSVLRQRNIRLTLSSTKILSPGKNKKTMQGCIDMGNPVKFDQNVLDNGLTKYTFKFKLFEQPGAEIIDYLKNASTPVFDGIDDNYPMTVEIGEISSIFEKYKVIDEDCSIVTIRTKAVYSGSSAQLEVTCDGYVQQVELTLEFISNYPRG